MAPSAERIARELADGLEARGVEYAVGGAIALAQWGVARATKDADMNLWMDPGKPMAVAELLGQLGCQFNASALGRAFDDKGLAYVFLHGVRVDIYLPTREFHASVKSRRRMRPLLGRDAWFLSAEDLTVFKMVIYRDKDLLDVRGIIALQGHSLDRSYVREWLARLVGAYDIRLKAWEEMGESAEEALHLKEEGWKPPFAERDDEPGAPQA